MLKNTLIVGFIAALTFAMTLYFDHTPPSSPSPSPSPGTKAAPALAEGRLAPDFSLKDRHGKTFKLSDFRGKTVILNFWASWCAPCVEEFPRLLELAGKNPDDTVLLALSSDFESQAMNRFLARMEKQFPKAMRASNVLIALDEDAAVTQTLFQTHLLPETILIDKEGKMRHKIPGANWSVEELSGLFKKL